LYYEQITDKELDNILKSFVTYDEETKNIPPAERLYKYNRRNFKPSLADFVFWNKFNLIRLNEKQQILLDKLIFEKIGNHKPKDLTEQEMSLI
jgi:hypothetical protein